MLKKKNGFTATVGKKFSRENNIYKLNFVSGIKNYRTFQKEQCMDFQLTCTSQK